jgi:hypothetical protein
MTEEQPTAHASAQRAYHQRQLDRGMVRLSVYVPKDEREAFHEAMELLRAQWRKRGHAV